MAELVKRDKTKEAESAVKKTAQTAKKTEAKAEGAVKKASETAKKPVAKAEQAIKQDNRKVKDAKPPKGSSVLYRVIAIVLWVLAIACEVFAIMILLDYFYVTNKLLWLIIFIVGDLILAIVAAQMWKRANHINPPSEKNKFLFYLISELGVIMACVCFIPLIIFLLKDKKLDKKTKTIASIVAVVALLIAGVASADFHPISAEQKQEAEEQITGDVYWTQFGHKYHLSTDCYHIKNSDYYKGTVTEAINSGRTAICSYCARHYGEGLDLEALNVEDKDAVLEEVGTAAPSPETK